MVKSRYESTLSAKLGVPLYIVVEGKKEAVVSKLLETDSVRPL